MGQKRQVPLLGRQKAEHIFEEISHGPVPKVFLGVQIFLGENRHPHVHVMVLISVPRLQDRNVLGQGHIIFDVHLDVRVREDQ